MANDLNFFFGLATRDLFFLPHYARFSLSKFKSLIFVSSIYFLHGSHSFAKLLHDGLVTPVQTAGSTQNISAATWSHVSPMLKCNDLTKSWQTFLKLSKVVEIGYWLIEIFYIHLSGCRNYYLSGYDTTVVATSLIYDNYMLWDFYSHSSLCYQDEILKTSGIFLSPVFSLVKNLLQLPQQFWLV